MRKAALLAFIFLFVFAGTGFLLSQENEEDGKLLKLQDEYFTELWKFYPTQGTAAGYHKFDNKLEDFSNKNVEKWMEALDKFNQELVSKVDRTKMSEEYQIDHQMMMDVLDIERLRVEQLIPWEYDPLFYNAIFLHAVRPLLKENFAPVEERAKNVTDRLKNLPKLIKQAQEILKTPTQISTETAIRQFPAILNIYRTEIPELMAQVPAGTKSKMESELAKVISALEGYQNFLNAELLPKSTGNFRLGEAHARLMRLTLQNNISIQELVERAKADVNNIQVEMALVCAPFYRIMYPETPIEQLAAQRGEEEARRILIKGVLDKIKSEHADREGFIDRIKVTVEEVKTFFRENDLVELPDVEPSVEIMPGEYQGTTWTRLAAPPAYAPDGEFAVQITPLPEDWSEEKTTSFLEEFNNFLLYFYTIRNIYPGSFVPFFYARQHPSLVRKLYPNMPLIKGWSMMFEEKLVYKGFGNYDLLLRLNQLKMRLKAVIDFIAEFQIHESNWTKDQATAYMRRVGMQTEAEAERKWNQILLSPCDAAYTYVGLQEIMDLEKQVRQIKGEAFSQKEFMKQLLAYGALPLRHLKTKILAQ